MTTSESAPVHDAPSAWPWHFSAWGSWALTLGTAITTLLVCVALQREMEALAKERLLLETGVSATHVANHFDSWINDRVRLLGIIDAEITSVGEFNSDAYENGANRILRLYPSYQAINWVSPEGLIERVSPLEGNEGALGRNLMSHPDPRVTESFVRAIESGSVVRTPATITLYQGGEGFATYWPVTTGDGQLLGVLNAVFRIQTLVSSVVSQEDIQETFSFALRESSGEVVYAAGATITEMTAPFTRRVPIDIAARELVFELTPLPATLPGSHFDPYDLLIPFGLLAALCAGFLVRISLNYGASLLQSERRFQDLYMTAPSAFFTLDESMRITRFNHSALELTGYSERDLYLSSLTQLCADGPLGREKLAALMKRGLDGQPVNGEEIHLRRHDGADAWALLAIDPVRDKKGQPVEIRTALVDITARKLADEALRESDIATRAILDGTLECIVTVDAEGIIQTCNAASLDLFGVPQKDVQGRPFGDFFLAGPSLGPDRLRYGVWDVRGKRANGEVFPMKLSITSIHLKGQPLFTCSMYDMTREKALENQLVQAQKLEAIGTLARGIAHDFNNLLHSMLAYVEMAIGEVRDRPKTADRLQEVLKATLRARDLVKQILLFSRQTGPERELVDVRILLQEVSSLMRGSLPPTVDFQTICDNECRAILANPGQLHQVVVNLCTNAFQALPDERGRIELGLQEVQIDSTDSSNGLRAGSYARIWVTDTGSGMDAETMSRIFEPYFTTKPVTKGTGLGLSTVHGIVTGHGGEVRVSSEIGQGTTFECFFPLMAGAPEEHGAPEQRPAADRRQVLLVDDEDIVLRSSRMGLERLGYAVDSYLDPFQALQTFEQSPAAFDAVVVDLSMPGLRGDELARRIKELRHDIPIVMCTGFGALINDDLLRESGIAICLSKPVSMRDLVDAIERQFTAQAP